MLLALILLAATVPAQKPPPAKIGNTKEIESPPPAKPAAPAPPAKAAAEAKPAPAAAGRCSDQDTALARALAFAVEPAPEEIRALAIEDLGFLGDARVLNSLAMLILDPSPIVQQAAVRAVRVYQIQRAEEILTNVIRHPSPSDSAKVLAVESLAVQRTRSAQRFLEHLKDTPQYSSRIQNAARQALQRGWAQPGP